MSRIACTLLFIAITSSLLIAAPGSDEGDSRGPSVSAPAVNSLPPQAQRSGRALSIYWDDYHDTDNDSLTGNYSTVYAELIQAGHTVVEKQVPITAAELAGFDVLVILDAETALSNAEVADVHAFVASGKGLFLIGENSVAFDPAAANVLLQPYGIEFIRTANGSVADTFNAHPVTTGLNTLEVASAGLLSGGTELGYTDVSELVLSVYDAAGRVAVWGDSNTIQDGYIGTYDEVAFLHNAIDWTGGGSSGAPVVNITCNGGQSGVTIPAGTNAKIEFSVLAKAGAGVPVDLWVALNSPFGFFCYDGLGSISGWWFGLGHAYYTGPLADVTATALDRPLPIGAYKALTGIDTLPNGTLDMGSLFTSDAVDFIVY